MANEVRADELDSAIRSIVAHRVLSEWESVMVNGLFLCAIVLQQAGEQTAYRAKLAAMPDFCQEDQRHGKLPFQGSVLCAPVAVSNALVWLDENGFPNIIKGSRNKPRHQAALIRELSSERYMFTFEQSGTAPLQMIRGLRRFLADRGYGVAIESMGWRSQTHSLGEIPDLEWMLKSVQGHSNLILNIGFYKLIDDQRVYRRTAGHYVTVVGFGRDGSAVRLYVHDPGKRGGLEKRTVAGELRELRAGTRLKGGLTRAADGFFELQGVELKSGNDLAIIDQAIAFMPVVRR